MGPKTGEKWPRGKNLHPASVLGTTPKILNQEKWSTQRLTDGLVENPELGNPTTKRLTLGLSENGESPNPATSQRLPPLSPSSPINIVHPSKGRRGSYLKVICRYLSCGPYAQGNPEGGLEVVKNPESGKMTTPRFVWRSPNGGAHFGDPRGTSGGGVTKRPDGF